MGILTFTFCYGKIHHFVAGKINDFDWAIFNSELLNYQRVTHKWAPCGVGSTWLNISCIKKAECSFWEHISDITLW